MEPIEFRPSVDRYIEELVQGFQEDLVGVALTGSAAEGRVRPRSDVNLMVFLTKFSQERAAGVREAYRVARASANVTTFFAQKEELPMLAEAFPVKFLDARLRHVALRGEDLLVDLPIRNDLLFQAARQSLLNLRLRFRERYMLLSLREEQLIQAIAGSSGSLRASAAAILFLEEQPLSSPRQALLSLSEELEKGRWKAIPEKLSQIRESQTLPAGEASALLFEILDLTVALQQRLDLSAAKVGMR